MSVNWQELVHAHYPAARPLSDVQASLRQLLTSAKGRVDGTMLATSFCPDDILASKDIGHEFLGPFNLGGMGALPMAGLTAWGLTRIISRTMA